MLYCDDKLAASCLLFDNYSALSNNVFEEFGLTVRGIAGSGHIEYHLSIVGVCSVFHVHCCMRSVDDKHECTYTG